MLHTKMLTQTVTTSVCKILYNKSIRPQKKKKKKKTTVLRADGPSK